MLQHSTAAKPGGLLSVYRENYKELQLTHGSCKPKCTHFTQESKIKFWKEEALFLWSYNKIHLSDEEFILSQVNLST